MSETATTAGPEIKAGTTEARTIVRGLVAHQISCPLCKRIMDMRQAIVIKVSMPRLAKPISVAMCAEHEDLATGRAEGVALTVYRWCVRKVTV